MDWPIVKTTVFREGRAFFILLLGFLVFMGWLILVLTALLSLETCLPALSSVTVTGKDLVTGSFFAIMKYPLVFLLLLLVAAHILIRSGWDEWF
jgi:hypothetical protein